MRPRLLVLLATLALGGHVAACSDEPTVGEPGVDPRDPGGPPSASPGEPPPRPPSPPADAGADAAPGDSGPMPAPVPTDADLARVLGPITDACPTLSPNTACGIRWSTSAPRRASRASPRARS